MLEGEAFEDKPAQPSLQASLFSEVKQVVAMF